jgi:hypothetical protein
LLRQAGMEHKRNPTRTRARPPEGSRRPGHGSKAPPPEPEKAGTDDYPGGGSSGGSDHPKQDELVRLPQPLGEGLIGLSGRASSSP